MTEADLRFVAGLPTPLGIGQSMRKTAEQSDKTHIAAVKYGLFVLANLSARVPS